MCVCVWGGGGGVGVCVCVGVGVGVKIQVKQKNYLILKRLEIIIESSPIAHGIYSASGPLKALCHLIKQKHGIHKYSHKN